LKSHNIGPWQPFFKKKIYNAMKNFSFGISLETSIAPACNNQAVAPILGPPSILCPVLAKPERKVKQRTTYARTNVEGYILCCVDR
jgi:hypothetical protein